MTVGVPSLLNLALYGLQSFLITLRVCFSGNLGTSAAIDDSRNVGSTEWIRSEKIDKAF